MQAGDDMMSVQSEGIVDTQTISRQIARRIATDMESLYQIRGDRISDDLGISISYLTEQFRRLADTWHASA